MVFLWNRTLVAFVDKLSSTTVDFIMSEGELKKSVPYIGCKRFQKVLGGSLSMLRTCLGGEKRKWAIKELRGQKVSYCNYTKINKIMFC